MFRQSATISQSRKGLDDRTVVIRWAAEADRQALADLAALDGVRPREGEALIAFVGDEPWAAVFVADGRVVADPFRPSAQAAELLRVRGEHLRAAVGGARGARRLALRRRAAGVRT
jgi:hypothetical protein